MTDHAGQWSDRFTDRAGNALPGLAITVYEIDGTTPATIYIDRDRSDELANPLPTMVANGVAGLDVDANAIFYADPDRYVITARRGATVVYTSPTIVQLDPADEGAGGSDDQTAAEVSFDDAGLVHVAGTDVQAAIESIDDAIIGIGGAGSGITSVDSIGLIVSTVYDPRDGVTAAPGDVDVGGGNTIMFGTDPNTLLYSPVRKEDGDSSPLPKNFTAEEGDDVIVLVSSDFSTWVGHRYTVHAGSAWVETDLPAVGEWVFNRKNLGDFAFTSPKHLDHYGRMLTPMPDLSSVGELNHAFDPRSFANGLIGDAVASHNEGTGDTTHPDIRGLLLETLVFEVDGTLALGDTIELPIVGDRVLTGNVAATLKIAATGADVIADVKIDPGGGYVLGIGDVTVAEGDTRLASTTIAPTNPSVGDGSFAKLTVTQIGDPGTEGDTLVVAIETRRFVAP